MCENITERTAWKLCSDFVKIHKASQKAFQFYEPKKVLLKIYPYLLSWEIYNFLKNGYNGLYYCKNCKEQITKLHETEFCCKKCKCEYSLNSYLSEKDLWIEAKQMSCKYETSRGATNAKRNYNPITLLSKLYDIPPRKIFTYLKFGIDPDDKKPVKKEYIYKSWNEIMGVDRANKRRDELIRRQTGKKHSKEWCNNIKKWYNNPNNLQSFKESISHIATDKAIHEKQRNTLLKKIESGEFTPVSNTRFRGKGVNFDGMHFRSKYELIYYAYCKYIEHDEISFESIRIPYFDTNLNKKRIYITDFYNITKNEIIEIKPKSYLHELKDKLIGVKEYLNINTNVKYKVITEKKLKIFLNELLKCKDLMNTEVFKNICKVYKSWIKN